MMQPRTMALILGAVVFSAAGQLLLKLGTVRVPGREGLAFLVAAARNPHVLAGLVAWAASTVCWLYVLRVTPLSRAYVLTSLTYVLVPRAGLCVFGERMRLVHAVGTALIIAGVACVLA